MYDPISPGQIPGDILNTQQAAQGIADGAAAAIGGAVHDVLGLPQGVLNALYNIGGILIGTLLIGVGGALLAFALFGDVLNDAANTIANPPAPEAQTPIDGAEKAVSTAATVAGFVV